MNRAFSIALMGLGLVGCGYDVANTVKSLNSEEETGCVAMEETALGMDGTTSSGYSVVNSVNMSDGEHSADLTWNDGRSTALTVSYRLH